MSTVDVDQFDVLDTFAPAWAALRGGVHVVLCAYHLIKLPDVSDVKPVGDVACFVCTEPCEISNHAVERWQERVGGSDVDGKLALEAFVREATTSGEGKRDAEWLVNRRIPGVVLVKATTSSRDSRGRPVITTVITLKPATDLDASSRARKLRESQNMAQFRRRTALGPGRRRRTRR
jgi:hypothetical protein